MDILDTWNTIMRMLVPYARLAIVVCGVLVIIIIARSNPDNRAYALAGTATSAVLLKLVIISLRFVGISDNALEMVTLWDIADIILFLAIAKLFLLVHREEERADK